MPVAIDAEFVPGISLVTVDISADGIDVGRNAAFGGAELLHNFFFAGFGNLEFPLGSVPAAMVGKDVRRLKVETTSSGAYVGTVQKVLARNKVQPGGWPNLKTGGFLGPLDLKFSPSGSSMWLVDFGGFFTRDSGAVGGFRCDPSPGDCVNGGRSWVGAPHFCLASSGWPGPPTRDFAFEGGFDSHTPPAEFELGSGTNPPELPGRYKYLVSQICRAFILMQPSRLQVTWTDCEKRCDRVLYRQITQ